MAAITLTPVDISTAAVVVNSELLYHVFTINGVTRVFYGKGGRDAYQIDVQESAASIAAASPNLVEVTTVNGAEYLFIGSGGTGDGIMFIDADGSGSKITFRYVEEANPNLLYSSDSPSVIAARINTPAPALNQLTTVTIPVSSAQLLSLNTSPVLLVQSPGIGYGINVINAVCNYSYGTSAYNLEVLLITNPSGSTIGAWQFFIPDLSIGFPSVFPVNSWYTNNGTPQIYENEDLIFKAANSDLVGGDGSLILTITYQIIAI